MKRDDLIERLIGFSPASDADEVPREDEQVLVRDLVSFLSARRVMYRPAALEAPEHCVSSVFVICDTLTGYISQIDDDGPLTDTLRGMRAACRKFLSTVHADRGRKLQYPVDLGHHGSWIFGAALGEFRGVMGVHLAHLGVRYHLEIGSSLAAIVPGHDRGEPA